MNQQLHAILMELDNRFDIEIEDYFKLSNDDKAHLTKLIMENFKKEIDRNPLFIQVLRQAFLSKLFEMEERGEYEKCDIYKRLIETIDRFTFF